MSTDDPKARLLEAAGEVFAEKGFEAATVRDICQKAEANVAAVNYHFGDKQQLYLECVKLANCSQEDLLNFEWPAGVPAEEKLRMFVTRMMSDMLNDERPTWHLSLMMREMSQPTQACEKLVESFIGPKFALLRDVLRELLPREFTEEQIQLHAFSVVGQCLLYRFHRAIGRILVGEEQFERFRNVELVAEHITRFSLDGILHAKASQETKS